MMGGGLSVGVVSVVSWHNSAPIRRTSWPVTPREHPHSLAPARHCIAGRMRCAPTVHAPPALHPHAGRTLRARPPACPAHTPTHPIYECRAARAAHPLRAPLLPCPAHTPTPTPTHAPNCI